MVLQNCTVFATKLYLARQMILANYIWFTQQYMSCNIKNQEMVYGVNKNRTPKNKFSEQWSRAKPNKLFRL